VLLDQRLGEHLPEADGRSVVQLPLEGDEHVQPRAAAGLDEVRKLELLAQRARGDGQGDHVLEGRGLGIEVEDAPVRVLEIRDPRAPEVEGDGPEVDQEGERLCVLADELPDGSFVAFHLHGVNPGRHVGTTGLLLEEALAVDPVREAGEHQRPVAQVRQHPRGDRLVVANEVPLAEAVLGEPDLVEVHEVDRPLLRAPGRQALLGPAVVAEPAEHRRPGRPSSLPLLVANLRDQRRVDPEEIAIPRRVPAGRRGPAMLAELALDPRRLPRPEATPHPAGVDELRTVVSRERERGQLAGVADDGEVSDVVSDDLLPVGSTTGVVGTIGSLGDDALQPHLLHGLVERLSFGLHRLDAPHAATVRRQSTQQLAAAGEREPAQIPSLGCEQIERPVGGRVRARGRTSTLGALLEEAEGGTPLGVLHHHLAVEDEVVGRQRAERLDDLGELLGRVTSASVPQADLPSAPLGEDPVTVVLQLEPPSAASERAGSPGGELEVHVREAHVPLRGPGLLDRAAKGRGRDRPVARRTSAGGHAEGGISTLSWRLARSARGQSPSAW